MPEPSGAIFKHIPKQEGRLEGDSHARRLSCSREDIPQQKMQGSVETVWGIFSGIFIAGKTAIWGMLPE